jgi:hypothetical protein
VANLVFEVLASIKDRDIVPLGSAFPSPELFPLQKLNKIAAAAARRLGRDDCAGRKTHEL